MASLWIASDVISPNMKQLRQHQRIELWQKLTKIEIYRHCLKRSVTKQVAGVLGLDPDYTSTTAMKGRVEAHLQECGQKKIEVDVIPIRFRAGKVVSRILGIFVEQMHASVAEALLKKHKMPMLSLLHASSKQSKHTPAKLKQSKSVCSRTRGIRIAHMTEEQAQELRRFLANSKDLQDDVQEDIVDVSGTQQPGVYYLKYVYLDEPRRKIITDVLSEELEAFGNAMQEGDAEPPQIADRTPGGPSGASVGTDARTEAQESDSEESGQFSKVSA